MQDLLVHAISKDLNFKITLVNAINLSNQAIQSHQYSGLEGQYLSETMVLAILYGSSAKEGARLTLSIKGNHVLKQSIVDFRPEGDVRGFIILDQEKFNSDLNPDLGPWQEGSINVVTQRPFEKEPYVGMVPLPTGYLSTDFNFYLNQSEQIASMVLTDIKIQNSATKNDQKYAFGILVQALPDSPKDDLEKLIQRVGELKKLNTYSSEKFSSFHEMAKKILENLFDEQFTILSERSIQFKCDCNQVKVEKALMLVGLEELQDMMIKDHGASIHCDYCNHLYAFSIQDLANIIQHLKKYSS